MADLHERYARIMLMKDFAVVDKVLPNGYDVLTILGEDEWKKYIEACRILKELWSEAGKNI